MEVDKALKTNHNASQGSLMSSLTGAFSKTRFKKHINVMPF